MVWQSLQNGFLCSRVPTPSACASTRNLSSQASGFCQNQPRRLRKVILSAVAYVPVYSYRSKEATSTTTATSGFSSVLSSVTHDVRVSSAVHRGFIDAYSIAPRRRSAAGDESARGAWSASRRNALDRSWPCQSKAVLVQSGRYGANSNHQFQMVDTWSVLRGAHEWRVGFEYQQVTASTQPCRLIATPIGSRTTPSNSHRAWQDS